MAIARGYSPTLRKRPGVVGLALYGSLAGDPAELTSFSDVDVAIILKGKMPRHFTEHRLVRGVKADLLFFHLDRLRTMGRWSPARLARASWIEDLFLKGLLRGGPDTVLYDPTGEIARAKRRLAACATVREVARRRQARELLQAGKMLTQAKRQMALGRHRQARQWAGSVLWYLTEAMLDVGETKRLALAAARLGVPGAARRIEALSESRVRGRASVAACRRAEVAVRDYLRREVYAPVEARLRREGVRDPDRLEFTGTLPLFWPGNRLDEYGRLKAEAELTLRWSGRLLAAGRAYDAFNMLTSFMSVGDQRIRCGALADALRLLGHDVRPIVERCLASPAFRRLRARAERAQGRAWRWKIGRAEARRFVEGVTALHREVVPRVTG
jgi:hypothetical protein